MCIAKLKCFLSLKIISSFSESVSWLILLLPFSLCNANEGIFLLQGPPLVAQDKDNISCLTGLSAGITNTEIPGL